VVVHWYRHYHLPGLPLLLAVGLLVLVVKANWTPRAWPILVLPLGALAVDMAIGMSPSATGFDAFGFHLTSLAAIWAAVWLAGPWLVGGTRAATLGRAAGLILAMGALAGLGYHGLTSLPTAAATCVLAVMGPLALMVAMMISGYSCRTQYQPGRFMLWLMLWIVVASAGCAAVAMALSVGLSAPSTPQAVLGIFMGLIMGFFVSPFLAGALYAFNVPFMILAFYSSPYQKRLRGMFQLPGAENCQGDAQNPRPLSTANHN